MGIGHEVVPVELVPLEGVGEQHLLQDEPKAKPLIQNTHPKED